MTQTKQPKVGKQSKHDVLSGLEIALTNAPYPLTLDDPHSWQMFYRRWFDGERTGALNAKITFDKETP